MEVRKYAIQNKVSKRIIFISASRHIALLRFKMYDKDFYRVVIIREEK